MVGTSVEPDQVAAWTGLLARRGGTSRWSRTLPSGTPWQTCAPAQRAGVGPISDWWHGSHNHHSAGPGGRSAASQAKVCRHRQQRRPAVVAVV